MIKLDAFLSHLNRASKGSEPLKHLYLISSDEPLLVMEAQDRLRAAVLAQGFSERTLLLQEKGFDWGELLNAGQTMSLFGDKKFIELRMPTGKPGKEGGDALKKFASQIEYI